MTLQLGELLEKVYRSIRSDVVDGVATSGSNATTIEDTTLSTKYTQNRFKDWIAFISRTTDGASPQGKYSIASAYVASTKKVTIATVTQTVDTGDEYALCKPDIPLYTLIKLCNDALKMLDLIWVHDTSLTVTADDLTYTLPAAAKGKKLRSVYQLNSDNQVCPAPNYSIDKAAGGTQNSLRFHWQPDTTYPTLVIEYLGLHPALTAYNSYIDESIHPELATAACVERAFDWKAYQKNRAVDLKNLERAQRRLAEMKALHPIERPIIENQRLPISIFN